MKAKHAPSAKELAEEIRTSIVRGERTPGQRMPTVRGIAAERGVSSDTVFRAYKMLESNGLLVMRRGAQTSVADPLPGQIGAIKLKDLVGSGPVNEFETLSESANVRSFATNVADPRLFQADTYLAEMREVLERGPWGFYYAPPEGDLGLRHAIADWLNQSGTQVLAENIVVTLGSQQGMTLVGRYLKTLTDEIVIEGADHLGGPTRWKAIGLSRQIVSRTESDQIDWGTLNESKARALIVTPTGCGATGRIMPLQDRQDLIEHCRGGKTQIVEDTSNSWICYENRPRDLVSFDPAVIQIGSFANVLVPGTRVGYIVAPREIAVELARSQQVETGGLVLPMQIALANFIRRGLLRDHLRRVLPRYRRRRDALMSEFAKHLSPSVMWTKPAAGFASKLTLPPNVDVPVLYRKAVEQGVAFTPGSMLFGDSESANAIRVCFGNQTEARISEGVKILAALIKRHTET